MCNCEGCKEFHGGNTKNGPDLDYQYLFDRIIKKYSYIDKFNHRVVSIDDVCSFLRSVNITMCVNHFLAKVNVS